jgi:hypothetical protein
MAVWMAARVRCHQPCGFLGLLLRSLAENAGPAGAARDAILGVLAKFKRT